MKLSNFKAQVFKTFFVGLALIEVRYSQFHLCKANGIRSNTVGYILFILISDFNPIPRYLSKDILDLRAKSCITHVRKRCFMGHKMSQRFEIYQ